MSYEDLKERLKETFQGLIARVRESSAWMQLSEKYQDLSPNAQKAVLATLGALAAFLIFLIPGSFYFAANDSLAELDSKKSLMRELFRVTRADQALPPLPITLERSELEGRVREFATAAALQPDQIAAITPIDEKPPGLPKALRTEGISVTLNKLNVRQLVDLGSRFQSIAPTVKMTGVEITAAQPDPHFFNVTFKLIAFAVPPEPVAKPPARGARKPTPPADEE